MNKQVLVVGDKNTLLFVIKRIFLTARNANIETILIKNEQDFDMRLLTKRSRETFVLLNTDFDTSAQVNKWLWNKLRLNEKQIGKELAGLPIIVLGMGKNFLETPEGQVFQDFRAHHKYLPKPLNFYSFLVALDTLSRIDPSSLCVIKRNAPDEILEVLEQHDLKDISKKFNFSGSGEELKRRFHKIETKLRIYTNLKKNKKEITKLRKEVEKLREEIIKRRGNIWK